MYPVKIYNFYLKYFLLLQIPNKNKEQQFCVLIISLQTVGYCQNLNGVLWQI